jgi:hypothetical protein
MTAVSAEENSLSSKRSWNLKAELSPICLNAGSAETALGATRPPQLAASFILSQRERESSKRRGSFPGAKERQNVFDY